MIHRRVVICVLWVLLSGVIGRAQLATPSGVRLSAGAPPSSGSHAYFNTLVARADHFRSYALRTQAQIALYRASWGAPYADYVFPTDPDPRRQDGVKLVIPAYTWSGTVLSAPITASDTVFTAPTGLTLNPQTYYQIDAEVMVFQSRVGQDVTVTRGANGTTPAAHAAGARINKGSNSLQTQVRLPLVTSLGHRYLFTWDSWFGAEMKKSISGIDTYKHWQFARTNRGTGSLGWEVRSNFGNPGLAANEVAWVDLRHYGTTGPGVTLAGDSIRPQVGSFNIRAETWTRYWVLVEHIENDWDRLSLWMADTTRGPIQIHDRLSMELSALGQPNTLVSFWLELNTSLDVIKAGRPSLVSSARNFVALQDVPPADIPGLLAVRPL